MRLPILLTVLLVSAPAFAQGRAAFATDCHDFARIDEGPVATTAFAFVLAAARAVLAF